MSLNLSTILAVASLLGTLIVIDRFRIDKRTAAVNDGRKEQVNAQVHEDIIDLKKRVNILEERFNQNNIDLAEIKRDMKYVLEGLGKIEKKLDRECA
ncbi:hypothetical protein SDC9_05175 [bioreactor metagenome]|uniref:Uncharacterized protein n=1 Tax=bioreactor metagenome TaxID=1076179 RepID=A0A644T124_9ZZZZ